MTNLNTRAWISLTGLVVVLALPLFVPAGTLDYWQAWVYLTLFALCGGAITRYLMQRDPALLPGACAADRRRAGTEPAAHHGRRLGGLRCHVSDLGVGSPLHVVRGPALCHAGWRSAPCRGVLRRISRVQSEHLCLGHDRSRQRTNGDCDRRLRAGPSPDVRRRTPRAPRYTLGPRLVVGIRGIRPDGARRSSGGCSTRSGCFLESCRAIESTARRSARD